MDSAMDANTGKPPKTMVSGGFPVFMYVVPKLMAAEIISKILQKTRKNFAKLIKVKNRND